LDELIAGSENRFGVVESDAASFRQNQLPAAAFEQALPKLRLKVLHLNRQRRRRDVQRRCRAGQRPGARDCTEIAEMMEV
jgi:hypothetical protein